MPPDSIVDPKPLRVVAIQHAAGTDVDLNLAELTDQLPTPRTADLVVLPEVFACRGNREALLHGAEPIGGRITQWLAREAARRHCWILGGSLVERDGERCFNTSLLFNRQGEQCAAYRKLHLFDATLTNGGEVRESRLYTAGDKPCLVDIEGWRCGLSICYDLRFPELYRHYLTEGATVLLVPANFTDETGRAHWEVLVRARAIENQCFVIAPDQCGSDPHSGVKSHGHSLIVDPWGRILAQADEAPAVLDATLQPAVCDAVRRTLPAWRHRRPDGIIHAMQDGNSHARKADTAEHRRRNPDCGSGG